MVHEVLLSSSNALSIVTDYDVVLDCTDNVSTRYLLNDACVLAKKPLVSGSALRFEGQLTVYNYKNGPTYRCLYPSPPPPETVTNCSDGGVVGVVPGVIGVLQALEAIKVATGAGEVLSGRLLVFDGFSGNFRTVKLRSRRPQSDELTGLIDYTQFCGGAGAHDKEEPLKLITDAEERITVEELKQRIDDYDDGYVLVDVRSAPEMDICCIRGSVNVPFATIGSDKGERRLKEVTQGKKEVIFICRRGNDSQRALHKMRRQLLQDEGITRVVDVQGGLHAWTKRIDQQFPIY